MLLTSLRVPGPRLGGRTRIDEMATREFTRLRTPRPLRTLVDLWARSDERDYEERHYSDQNVDNAAHRDPANSSHRRPFRR